MSRKLYEFQIDAEFTNLDPTGLVAQWREELD